MQEVVAGKLAPSEATEGGLLQARARAEAVEQAFPLLATYFSSAETWELSMQSGPQDRELQLDLEIARALRVRVLLALAEDLLSILQAISSRPSFRYASQEEEESSGLLAGRLDIPRYTQRRRGRTAPRVYPIRVIERDQATPENLLAVAALEAVDRAVSAAPLEILPKSGPERRDLQRVRGDLLRHRQLPFVNLLASKVRRGRGLTLEQRRRVVQRRLERGDIGRAEPYRRLLTWVRRFHTGSDLELGPENWHFYDERFDSRLFEIWSLACLASLISERFGAPEGGSLAPLWDRAKMPIAVWNRPFGQIELFFQREMGTLGRPGRWHIKGSTHPLRAIPDVVIRVGLPDGESKWLLLDCKLRAHDPLPKTETMVDRLDLPSEEIYKLLGYFDHLMADTSPCGGLIYYTPGGNAQLEMSSILHHRSGILGLLGVDPSDPDAAHTALRWILRPLGDYLLGADGEAEHLAKEAANRATVEGLDEVEKEAAYKQRLMVEVIRNYAKDHEDQQPAIQKLTASWFEPEVWDGLDPDTRRMVLSAELYGSAQLEQLDHSGPLLVLSAACERELNQRLFKPVVEMFPDEKTSSGEPAVDNHATLGGAIETMHRGGRLAALLSESADDAEQQALGNIRNPAYVRAARLTGLYLQESNQDLEAIAALVKRLRKLNFKFRRPAAHDQVVEAAVWSAGRNLILGTDGVLTQIVRTL